MAEGFGWEDVHMADVVREVGPGLRGGMVVRRKLNWSAIWAGIVATLGILILMVYLGSALGLSVFNPYQGTFHQLALTWSVIGWLALSIVVASFFGAWIAGRWGNLYDGADAMIHGVSTWALSLLFASLGVGLLLAFSSFQTQSTLSSLALPGMKYEGKALSYNSLDDARFTGFLVNRANQFAASQPMNVTAEDKKNLPAGSEMELPAKPGDLNKEQERSRLEDQSRAGGRHEKVEVAQKSELLNYLTAQTNLDAKQAKDFIHNEKDSIAAAQHEGYQRWHQAHARDIAVAQRDRVHQMQVWWSIFGLSALALLFALLGSYLGWTGRYEEESEEEIVTRAGPTQPGTL
jgi:hypothetical protein